MNFLQSAIATASLAAIPPPKPGGRFKHCLAGETWPARPGRLLRLNPRLFSIPHFEFRTPHFGNGTNEPEN